MYCTVSANCTSVSDIYEEMWAEEQHQIPCQPQQDEAAPLTLIVIETAPVDFYNATWPTIGQYDIDKDDCFAINCGVIPMRSSQ